MRVVLYVVGLALMAVGGLIVLQVFGSAGRGSITDAQAVGLWLAAVPGFSLIGSGLLFLVAAFVLRYLELIEENTDRQAAYLKRIADAMPEPAPGDDEAGP